MVIWNDLVNVPMECKCETALAMIQDDFESLLYGRVDGRLAKEYLMVALEGSSGEGAWRLNNSTKPGEENYSRNILRPSFLLTGMLAYSYLAYEEVRAYEPFHALLHNAIRFCTGKLLYSRADFAFADSVFRRCNVAELLFSCPEFNPAIPADEAERKQMETASRPRYSWEDSSLLTRMNEEQIIRNLMNDDYDDPRVKMIASRPIEGRAVHMEY